MNKVIHFLLNNFATTPAKLRRDPITDKPKDLFEINLCRLYHHYYIDSYGKVPPAIDHANFEYLRFLSKTEDFRFFGEGPAVSVGKKRIISTELGQAFCRYFLYEFLNITYFAHMDRILNKETHPAFNGIKIKRTIDGDVPDYLCARSVTTPYIAEAKGRFTNISFNSCDFDNWRDQFNRIEVLDKNNRNYIVKGYIVATKFVTEENRKSNMSKVLAEDPSTIGEFELRDDQNGLGLGCIAIHYSRLLSKLGLELISSALENGFIIPEELSFNLPVWRCNYGPIAGERFIGGYISDHEVPVIQLPNGRLSFAPNILRINSKSPFFVGLKLETFRMIRRACLGNWRILSELPDLPDINISPSNLAWLRDGSISGSLEFFEFENIERI